MSPEFFLLKQDRLAVWVEFVVSGDVRKFLEMVKHLI